MALSGNSGWINFGPYSSFGIYMEWSASQNVGGNYSDVTATLKIRSNNSGSYFTYNSSIGLQINGTSKNTTKNFSLGGNGTVTMHSATVRVPHNSDGSKSFSINFNFSNPVTGSSGTKSTAVSLNKISRVSSLTWDSSFFPHTYGKDVRLTVNSGSSDFYHSIEVRTRGVLRGAPLVNSRGGGVKTFNIPLNWANNSGDTTLENCSFRLITHTKPGSYASDSLIGYKDYSGQISVPGNIVPTISNVTYTDQNSTVSNITGSNQILVQGKSIPQMAVTSSGAYGSSITQFRFEIGGITYNHIGSTYNIYLENLANLSGSQNVKVTVTDTRGRTATYNKTLDIRAYTAPYFSSFSVSRNSADKTIIDISKKVVVSSIKNGTTEKNPYTVTTYIKKVSASSWTTEKVENNVASSSFPSKNKSITDSFDVQVVVADKFGSIQMQDNVSTDTVLMSMYKDEGIGFGKYYEPGHGIADFGGDIHLNGNVVQNGSIFSSSLPAGDTTTINYWAQFPKGRSVWWYGNDSNVKNTPSSWGFVEVTKAGPGNSDFSVLWYTQASGQIYRTSGNANSITGWNDLIQSVQPYYLFNTTRAVAKPWGDIAFPWQNTLVQGGILSVDSTDNTKIKVNKSGWYEFYISGTITGATAGRWYDLGIMSAYDNSGTKYDGQNWVQQYTKRGHYYPPNNKEFVIAQTFTVRLEAGYCLVGSNGDDSTGTISNIWCTFKRIADKNW